MNILILTAYAVLLIMALAYAGIVIYHVVKYRQDDLPPRQGQHAMKIMWIYLSAVVLVLVTSVAVAVIIALGL